MRWMHACGRLADRLAASGECKADLREDFQVWFAIHSTLRPLCASVLRTLEKRGVAGSAKELSNLEEEGMKFRVSFWACVCGLAGRGGCFAKSFNLMLTTFGSKLAQSLDVRCSTGSGRVRWRSGNGIDGYVSCRIPMQAVFRLGRSRAGVRGCVR